MYRHSFLINLQFAMELMLALLMSNIFLCSNEKLFPPFLYNCPLLFRYCWMHFWIVNLSTLNRPHSKKQIQLTVFHFVNNFLTMSISFGKLNKLASQLSQFVLPLQINDPIICEHLLLNRLEVKR